MGPSFLYQCLDQLKYGTIVLLIVGGVFGAMEAGFSFQQFKKPWKSTLLDLKYWLTSIFYPPTVDFALAAFFAFFSLRRTTPLTRPTTLGFAINLMALLIACDIWAYIRHRIFHSKLFWRFHSIHHSSEQVTWLSGVRLHPIESFADIVGETLAFMIAALIGVGPRVLTVAGIGLGVWNFFIHSNTPWTFGPLRYLLVSPVQHRWHHSDTKEAMDKNFAVMFSCIDVLLGTFYMPKNIYPKTTGLMGDERKTHPHSFAGQLLYPFKR